MAIDRRENVDWNALREEYLAGSIGMKALAARHGVSLYALRRRAKDGGWTALRREAAEAGKNAVNEPAEQPAGLTDEDPGRAAARLYLKLLRRLERVTDAIPDGAVTEFKTQDDEAAKLFKLRDLTAAYKDIAGDLPGGGEAQAEKRVIIDV